MSKLKKTARNIHHYLPLVSILLAGVLGIIIFSYDKSFQVGITIATAVGYMLWGVVHHHIHNDLYFSVFIEYFLIGVVGILIVVSLLLRA